jgi:phosphoribosylanthranilate isomerase
MRPLVKICGLSDRAALCAAIDAGADAVGFVFSRSVRQVTPEQAAELGAEVPAHVQKIAVMLHPTDAEWQAVRNVFRPDVLQTDLSDFAYLDVPENIGRWPVLREGGAPADAAWPALFVYEGHSSGRGQTVDWQLAARHARRGRMVLAGGLACDNVAEAIRAVRPYGVDVSSGVEAAPGKKDVAKIRAFIAAVHTAAATDEERAL